MAPITNRRILFNEIPAGFPEPGKTTKLDSSATVDIDNVPLNGGVLAKTLLISPDPYMRGRMREASKKSYASAFKLNESINGFGIGVVLRSETEKFKQGDKLYGFFDWQDYCVIPSTSTGRYRVLPEFAGVPLSSYLGVNGMPGKTAFYGLKEFSKMKKGETMFVSTGAGAVGAVVCQLAKIAGLKVIASTGSDEKVDWLHKELGVDVAFNYKTTATAEILNKEGPIDIYWDSVGGPTLDAAIAYSNQGARHILCGAITEYNNDGERYGIKNMDKAFGLSLSFNGFVVTRLMAKSGSEEEFYAEMPKLVAEGKLKYKEQVTNGLESAERAFVELFKGDKFGKAIVVIAED